MIDLLTQLRDSSDPEQHIHLDQGVLPMTENSANLVLFKEEETWFTGEGDEGDAGRYPKRDIDPKQIYAIQFIHYPPDDLPDQRAPELYRVLKVEPGDRLLGEREGVPAAPRTATTASPSWPTTTRSSPTASISTIRP